MMGFLGLGGLSFTLGGSIKGKIFFQETMVVTMGNEDVKETNGSMVKRRYTNVWQKQGNDWKLSFRHANLVCP